MLEDKQESRADRARTSFRKLMLYVFIAAALMEIGLLIYLFIADVFTKGAVLAGSFGVMVSVILGGGLMALAFLSSNSGHDDNQGRR